MQKNSKKIAVIAPPFTVIPPKGQGGTEKIVYEMVEGFHKKGYKVTLFGAGNCKTSVELIQIFKKPINDIKSNPSHVEISRPLRLEAVYLVKVMEEIIKRRKEFDLIFNHARGGYLFLPLSNFLKIPIITILHLPIFKELAEMLMNYKKTNIITVSNSQRKDFEKIDYLATIYNGVDPDEFIFSPKVKDHFLFMGALGEHKNPKDSILAAKKAGAKLILAGGKQREPYFSKEIKPLIDNKKIIYAGEVCGKKRLDLLKYAKALLFPIKWEEPFGLVMIEAMACGTPVIAFARGSVPETIKDGETGFIINFSNNDRRGNWLIKKTGLTGMIEAIKKIHDMPTDDYLEMRKNCREHIESNFTTEKMIDEYEKVYLELCRK
ncbi:MAG: glycosyltransferase family 4 protein [Parcubacteria group bacterium]